MMKYFNENTTYDEIKTTITEKSSEYLRDSTKNLIWLGLNALNSLDDNDRVVSYVKRVDDVYKPQFMQKLPTILYGLGIMSVRPDFADKLSDDALMLYSHAYCHDEATLDNIYKSISINTPEILEEICLKTKDIEKRENLHTIAESMYIESNLESDEKNTYVCSRIQNMTDEEYKELCSKHCIENVMEELAKIGIKI